MAEEKWRHRNPMWDATKASIGDDGDDQGEDDGEEAEEEGAEDDVRTEDDLVREDFALPWVAISVCSFAVFNAAGKRRAPSALVLTNIFEWAGTCTLCNVLDAQFDLSL